MHEVVDGQQRIRTVLDFYKGDIRLSKGHGPHAGKTYADLDRSAQKAFLSYEFSVDLLVGATDADVLNVFARINSYSAPLNAQEKRNARFFGAFKIVSYELAYEHLEFWKKHRILTDKTISRMREVELTSELMIAMSEGLQDKKKSIDGYYERWEENFPHENTISKQFEQTIDLIETFVGNTLEQTVFHRPVMFYSLFVAMHALRYGKENVTGKRLFTKGNTQAIRKILSELSSAVEAGDPHKGLSRFVEATKSQTDNIGPRRIRHNTIVKALSEI